MLAATVGCKQQCFITNDTLNTVVTESVHNLEAKPDIIYQPTIGPMGAPPDIYNPDRPIRYMSLAEAVAIALEQGTVGSQSAQGAGVSTDNLVTFAGRSAGGSDAIRVLALDPAAVGAGIEQSLSKFDAVWNTSMTWMATDEPIATALSAFQAGQSGVNAIVQQDATLTSSIIKPLPTGGIAGITFNTAYQFTNLPARVNPSYRPSLQFQFEQPLLQGFGVEINQIRPNHPGSVLNVGALNTTPTQEGILVTRIRFDQQRAEFERNVNVMLVNVEVAYWNLYGAYWNLYAREQALRFAYEAWKLSLLKQQVGRESIADTAQALGQYELFRGQRLAALDQVLENERQLRNLLSLQTEDGTRIVPSDTPNLVLFKPDWNASLEESMALRPELFIARQDIKANQLNVLVQKNLLLPDLRFTATYNANSVGNRLDGPDSQNALRNLASDRFNDYSLGVRLNVPLGYRNAQAQLRIARLQLARSYEVLKDQEFKAQSFLAQQWRRLTSTYEQIIAQRAQREAFAEQLKARYERYRAGKDTLDILLQAQRFWADALANEYAAIVQYNNAIVGFEFAKGTVQQHDNVVISEGALAGCAQVRAVEHLRERSKALVLRERPAPVSHAELIHASCPTEGTPAPGLTPPTAASLPGLYKTTPPLRDVPKSADLKSTPLPESARALEIKSLDQAPRTTELPKPAAPTTLPTLPAAPRPVSGSTRPSDFGTVRPLNAATPEAPTASPPSTLDAPKAPSLPAAPTPVTFPGEMMPPKPM
jgi:outer membrane protein TolC